MLQFLLFLFISVVLIQFIYYILIFGKFSFSKTERRTIQNVAVSVIICAKNKEENIKILIPLLVKQNYPNFEIVLIDDASSDETLEIFEAFEKQFSNIKLVKVNNNEAFWGNKKFALTLGIKAAKNEYLLFIDPDCYPTTPDWITEMTSHFSNEKTIILGYSGIEKIKNSFLNVLIRFDSVLTATQYFSWAKIGKPYMGVGKNLAYKRSEFFKTNGFINHMKIRAGADDLFINEVADKHNTAIVYSPESFTMSEPITIFSNWFTQKKLQLSTSKYYKISDKLQLRIFYFSQVLVLTLPIILFSWQFQWQLVIGLLLFRYIFAWISLGYSASKLQQKQVMYWFPIFESSLIVIQFCTYISNLFSKSSHWK